MRFFVDEDLDGPSFLRPLVAADLRVVRQRERFSKGAEDRMWIPLVAAEGLIILSANTKMAINPIEVNAIIRSRARILYLHQGKNTTHSMLGELFVRSQGPIGTFFASEERPRVGVLKRQHPSRDPKGTKPGRIEVPKNFR